jgi:hypothetical protein
MVDNLPAIQADWIEYEKAVEKCPAKTLVTADFTSAKEAIN